MEGWHRAFGMPAPAGECPYCNFVCCEMGSVALGKWAGLRLRLPSPPPSNPPISACTMSSDVVMVWAWLGACPKWRSVEISSVPSASMSCTSDSHSEAFEYEPDSAPSCLTKSSTKPLIASPVKEVSLAAKGGSQLEAGANEFISPLPQLLKDPDNPSSRLGSE
eukprot:4684571-Pleurochrysis_carterae.AAC.1